jgi:hypothetical protein
MSCIIGIYPRICRSIPRRAREPSGATGKNAAITRPASLAVPVPSSLRQLRRVT